MDRSDEAGIAVLFEEWKTRYDADPDGFMDCDAVAAQQPKTYGESAARYFLRLFEELKAAPQG